MKLLNFSQEERDLARKILEYAPARLVPLEVLPPNVQIIKSDNFFAECEKLAAYTSGLGLENGQARLVFTTARGEDGHTILLNADTVQGRALAHVLLTQLIHLAHLVQYSQEHGNVHRYDQEQAVANDWYEFLLWTRFSAMATSAKANALLVWHEAHGPEPPKDGCYSFGHISFRGRELALLLEQYRERDKKERQNTFWPLAEELVAYLGGLACYQQVAQPQALDQDFPEALVEETLGLDNLLALYSALLRSENYAQWKTESRNIRKAIIALQQWSAK